MHSSVKQLYVSTQGIATKFYPGLNGAKGFLVLLVVFTHCLPPSMLLYFLYFFHMPLFMAISGFLLKQTAFQKGYKFYMTRLWHRLILPWIIASFIFIPLKLSDTNASPLQMIDFIYPYYHLWYIPSYIIGATICYWMVKRSISAWIILLIFAVVTVVWYNLYRDSHLPVTSLPLYWLGEKRLFAYLFFFIAGFCLRNGLIKNKLLPIQLLFLKTIAFAALTFLIFKKFSSLYIVWPYMIFNTALVIFVLTFVAPKKWLQNKLFLLVNEQSLGIYLYHPLVLTVIYSVIGDREQKHVSNLQACGVFVLVILLTMILVWVLKKWSITNRYALGNIET